MAASPEKAPMQQYLTFAFTGGPDKRQFRRPVPKYALEPLATEQALIALPLVPCDGESEATVVPLVTPDQPDEVAALLACVHVNGHLVTRQPIPVECEALEGSAQDCWLEIIQHEGLDEKARAVYQIGLDGSPPQVAPRAARGLRILSGGVTDRTWKLSGVPHRPLTELIEAAQLIGTISRGNCAKLFIKSAFDQVKEHVHSDIEREAMGTLHGRLFYDCQIQRAFTVVLKAHPLLSATVQADETSVTAPPEALDEVVNEELPLLGVYHTHIVEDPQNIRVAAISPTDKRLIRHRLAAAWKGSLIINVAGTDDSTTAYMFYSWQRGEVVAEPGLAVVPDRTAEQVLTGGVSCRTSPSANA